MENILAESKEDGWRSVVGWVCIEGSGRSQQGQDLLEEGKNG